MAGLPAGIASDRVIRAAERSDEVLRQSGGGAFDEADAAGTTQDLVMPITPGDDIHINVAVLTVTMIGEQTGGGTINPSGQFREPGEYNVQISTRNNYTVVGGDDELPAGVLFDTQQEVQNPFAFEDETNGTGGLASSYASHETYVATDAMLDVLSTPDIDEGTTIAGFAQVQAVPTDTIQIVSTLWLWISER